MLEVLERTVAVARRLVSKFDPARLSGPQARSAVELFASLEKLAAAGKLLAAARLDATGAWADGGHRDVEAFLAATAGVSVGAARGAMKTARRVETQPGVEHASRAGALSPAQAEVVAGAVTADRTAEGALLALAKTAGFKGLKSECDRVTAAARSCDDEADNYERIHRERSLRHQTLRDGSGRIEIRGPLDRTAQIMAALEPLERELFEQNRTTKTIVHPDAVASDAMVAMAEHFVRSRSGADSGCESAPEPAVAGKVAKTPGSRPLAMIVVHVSHAAYERGWTEPSEICEIDRHLEIDHNIPVAAGGLTELANLGRLCHHHHTLKTLRDLRRIGPLGNQTLVTKQEHARAGP